jgi:TPR repeat protein
MNLESCSDNLWVQAKEGDPEAQFKVGEYYRHKNGVGSIAVAAEWFLKAATQDYAPAQVALALLYMDGLEAEDYERNARYWLQKAAHSGCKESSKLLRELLSTDEDLNGAVLLAEADMGNTQAQFELGCMLYYGQSGSRNVSAGLNLIQKAALAGHAKAQVRLAYERLFGTHMDKCDAFKWLWLSANQGNAEALYYLGACYYEGWGVTKNNEQAAACLLKSAKMGNSDAQYHLAGFYHEGIGLTANQEQEEAWCREAALQGNENAKEMLRYLKEVWEQEEE